MLAIDTETTGFDLYHGCRPYFVTGCDDDGNQWHYEWDVDPLTRQVNVPFEDQVEIDRHVREADALVGHNIKFDVTALLSVGCCDPWPWDKTEDTTYLAHLLASNRPKNLTDLAAQRLGIDVQPFEDRLEVAVKECRRRVQQARARLGRRAKRDAGKRKGRPKADPADALAAWQIADEGRPDAPSVKGDFWKADGWLPRAFRRLGFADDRPDYDAVLAEYADADSAATVMLWKVMTTELEKRGLGRIYREKLKLLRIGHALERRGVTTSGTRQTELVNRYRAESEAMGRTCVTVAASYGHALELPKNGVNGSLRTFMTDVLKLPPVYSEKAKTDAPTLNKDAMEFYLATLPERSKPRLFVETLLAKRSRDTALAYMAAYERFRLPADGGRGEWFVLHPSLNVTGTDTLRWSSSNPNEQNISKKEAECKRCRGEGCGECDGTGKSFRSVRYCFGPLPGREWWSLDAKNIELRLPFYRADEPELIRLFEEPDAPPYYGSNHLANFAAVYPEIWERELKAVGIDKVGPHCKKKYASTQYQWCKNGGFCKQYGGQRAKTDATFRRAGAFDLMNEKFSRLEAYNRQQIAFANRHGYVETIPDRTVDPDRGYPLIVTRTERGRVLETVPLSYHVQGSAMWWTCRAMARTQEALDQWNRERPGADYAVALQVHDEIVFDLPKRAHPLKNPKASNLGRVRELARLMALGGDDFGGIPTPVGIEYHESNWGEGVTLSA